MDTNTKIYIANLGKYNEGHLVGKWLDLPTDEDTINQLFVDIKVGTFDEDGEYQPGYCEGVSCYEEVAIHDYETDVDGLKIGEWSNIMELSEMVERLEDLEDYEMEAVEALIEANGYTLEQALEKQEDGDVTFYAGMNLTELAEQFVDEGLFSMETLLNYIDFEALGRDLGFDGYTETKNGVIYDY